MPPQAEALAKARHCQLAFDYIASPKALQNPPFAMRFGKDAIAGMVATWCTNDTPKSMQSRAYTLLVSMKGPSNPLRACPGEIHDLQYVGGLSLRETNLSPA